MEIGLDPGDIVLDGDPAPHVSTIGKKLFSSDMSSTCPHNMVNFGLLTAEIHPVV